MRQLLLRLRNEWIKIKKPKLGADKEWEFDNIEDELATYRSLQISKKALKILSLGVNRPFSDVSAHSNV